MPLIFEPSGLNASLSPLPSLVDDTTLLGLPDVVAWWDVTDPAKRTIVGGKVQDVTDKVNGYVVTQPTVAKQFVLESYDPATKLGGINGNDCAVGVGGQSLSGNCAAWNLPSGLNQGWIFAVVDNRQPDVTAAQWVAAYGQNQPSSASRNLLISAQGLLRIQANGLFLLDVGSGVQSGRHVLAGRFYGNGDGIAGFNDGLATDPPFVTGIGFNTVLDKMRIGGDLGGTAGNCLLGGWQHVVVTQGLSADTRDLVLTFLLWKAGRLKV